MLRCRFPAEKPTLQLSRDELDWETRAASVETSEVNFGFHVGIWRVTETEGECSTRLCSPSESPKNPRCPLPMFYV